MEGSAKCILLVSSYTADPIQEQDQRRARDLLAAKKVAFEEVDGALEENKELRNALFNISSQRGKYPQFFLERDGRHEFIGLWEQVEGLNEASALPAEVLAVNPGIATFETVFADVARTA